MVLMGNFAMGFGFLTATLSSWLNIGDSGVASENVLDGLRELYMTKVLPLEKHYGFHDFHSPAMDGPDFNDKPMVLLMGQYSTGKTTFIRYLLGKDFPGMRIGPEPTTDSFTAVMYGETDTTIPGNALVVDPKKQFRPLSKFGNNFLNRFQCSQTKSNVLKGLSIIDTPGILSGEKQRLDRGYDFEGVLNWFAERVDRIILLFDAHKLDISDEFRRSIEALKGNDDKVRIVLNKSDMMNQQQLMRVYGALLFSLGKIFNKPEVPRVYIGSFWDQPLQHDANRRLFEAEELDLFADLRYLPRNVALRKLNDLIKRVRLAKAHAYIISELKAEMPLLFGIEAKKRELIANLGQIYQKIHREHHISPGDFPDIKSMQAQLADYDFTTFNRLNPKLLETVDNMLAEDISKLMAMIPEETATDIDERTVKGGAFDGMMQDGSVSGYKRRHGIDEGITTENRKIFDQIFSGLNPINGKVSGTIANEVMLKSKLPNMVLGKVLLLSDTDKDGMVDANEFALMMYLINSKLDGIDLPDNLPHHLIPGKGKKIKNQTHREL